MTRRFRRAVAPHCPGGASSAGGSRRTGGSRRPEHNDPVVLCCAGSLQCEDTECFCDSFGLASASWLTLEHNRPANPGIDDNIMNSRVPVDIDNAMITHQVCGLCQREN